MFTTLPPFVREHRKNLTLIINEQRAGQLKFSPDKFPITNIPLTINFYPHEVHCLPLASDQMTDVRDRDVFFYTELGRCIEPALSR